MPDFCRLFLKPFTLMVSMIFPPQPAISPLQAKSVAFSRGSGRSFRKALGAAITALKARFPNRWLDVGRSVLWGSLVEGDQ